MSNNNKIIAAILALIFSYLFVIIPLLHRREATRVVQSVLNAWANNDYIKAFDGWEIQQKSPPVYGMTFSKIVKKEFGQADGVRTAKIYVYLEFEESSGFPSGKIWEFYLKKTHLGWKIAAFYPSENQNIPH